ncbi:MAG: F0F1 ATP synthase subunit B [Chloroflexi bacterium]|nr:F0F1 ATP synthase subunit B [Chloroflexota bacterium]
MGPVFLAGFVDGLKALGINLPSLIAQIINFTLLLVVLYLLAYKPVLRLLDERRKRIQEGMEASEEAKRRLAETEQEVAKELEKARQEGQNLVAQAQQISARIQEEAREQARREQEQMLARARGDIDLARDSAIAELRREFADLTITAAERVIRQTLDRRAHSRLIEETLAESTMGDGSDGGGEKQA